MTFYYNLETAAFTSGTNLALMDKYCYFMHGAAYSAGDDVLVPAIDLARIYSPDMCVTASAEACEITMNGKTVKFVSGSNKIQVGWGTAELKNSCEIHDGLLYVPVGQVMNIAFGKTVRTSNDINPTFISAEERGMDFYWSWPPKQTTVAVSSNPDFQMNGALLRYIDAVGRGKVYGEQFKTYWMDSPGKVIPYIMYIPSTYNPEKPSKLLVFLHGGSINVGEKYAFKFGGTKLQKACEKYGYVLLCANSVGLLSGFGGKKPISDPDQEQYYQWGDDSLMQAIEQVKAQYNIDAEHTYLMGNSMGGGATFSVSAAHPGMFRAIACGGASPRVAPGEDMSPFMAVPSIILAGTEDEFGFDNLLGAHKMLSAAGADNEIAVVAGGAHLTAWSEALDDAFDFFARHS